MGGDGVSKAIVSKWQEVEALRLGANRMRREHEVAKREFETMMRKEVLRQ